MCNWNLIPIEQLLLISHFPSLWQTPFYSASEFDSIRYFVWVTLCSNLSFWDWLISCSIMVFRFGVYLMLSFLITHKENKNKKIHKSTLAVDHHFAISFRHFLLLCWTFVCVISSAGEPTKSLSAGINQLGNKQWGSYSKTVSDATLYREGFSKRPTHVKCFRKQLPFNTDVPNSDDATKLLIRKKTHSAVIYSWINVIIVGGRRQFTFFP